jgi:hypothetical protein
MAGTNPSAYFLKSTFIMAKVFYYSSICNADITFEAVVELTAEGY